MGKCSPHLFPIPTKAFQAKHSCPSVLYRRAGLDLLDQLVDSLGRCLRGTQIASELIVRRRETSREH